MSVPGPGGARPDPADAVPPDLPDTRNPDPGAAPPDPPAAAPPDPPSAADADTAVGAALDSPGARATAGNLGPADAAGPDLAGPIPAAAVSAGTARPRHGLLLAVVTLTGLCCLAAAVLAGTGAIAGETQPPTRAERSAAAATAVAERWRAWPAGQIFPAALGYTTTFADRETARRVGISPDDQCAAALDRPLAGQARRDGCRAALRASYVDQLDGVVYTTGLLAFPSPAQARAFARRVLPDRPPVAGLRALALPGTASEMFDDAARQVATVRLAGPYVLLTVAGYADGLAAATGEYDPAAFRPASQLAAQILAPLARPAVVNCASRQWAC